MACRVVVISRSSFVQRACYDENTRELELKLRGESFKFSGVDRETVDGLRDAPSAGRYFNEVIKDGFSAR